MQPWVFSDYLKRYFLLICGLFIIAVGVVLSIKANIGISAVSCLPYVLSRINTSFTVGQFTAAMHVCFVLIQIFLLRRNFPLHQLLQLMVGIILGYLIDFAMIVLAFLQPASYPEQVVLFVLSLFMVGFGMFLEVKAGVLMVAGEGLVKAIAVVTKSDFGKIKIFTDCGLVSLSLITGLVFTHSVIGIREGTVLAALLVGLILKFLNKYLHFVDFFLERGRSIDDKLVEIPS